MGIRYFRMQLQDSIKVQHELWKIESEAGIAQTTFRSTSSGLDTSVWIPGRADLDLLAEALFRTILDHLKIQYEEGDEQQVVSHLDYLFDEE